MIARSPWRSNSGRRRTAEPGRKSGSGQLIEHEPRLLRAGVVGVGVDCRLQVRLRPLDVAQKTGVEHPELEVGAGVPRGAGQHLLLDRRGLVVAGARAEEDPEVEEGPRVSDVDLARR